MERRTVLRGLVGLPVGAVAAVVAAQPARADFATTVNPAVNWGTWEGWGTSLAWWANQLGPREDLADVQFSRKTVQFRGQSLPGREELVQLASILLIAGHETTANMISLGTYTLLRHPDRLAELRADPGILPEAVEELLRFLSIADGMLRVAREDVEVGGVVIRAGEGVVFSTSLINRDSGTYADPDSLDWVRSARHHLAFGYGIHQCLGQNLARAELEIALGTLLRRLPGLRLAAPAEEIPFKPGDTIQGMLELPVTW